MAIDPLGQLYAKGTITTGQYEAGRTLQRVVKLTLAADHPRKAERLDYEFDHMSRAWLSGLRARVRAEHGDRAWTAFEQVVVECRGINTPAVRCRRPGAIKADIVSVLSLIEAAPPPVTHRSLTSSVRI